jgi:hypothetical protein
MILHISSWVERSVPKGAPRDGQQTDDAIGSEAGWPMAVHTFGRLADLELQGETIPPPHNRQRPCV